MLQPHSGHGPSHIHIEALKYIELVRIQAKDQLREAQGEVSEASILLDDAESCKRAAKQDIQTAESEIAAANRYLSTAEKRPRCQDSIRNQALQAVMVNKLNTATEAKRAAKQRLKTAEDDIFDAQRDRYDACMKKLRAKEKLQSTECEWRKLLQDVASRRTSCSSSNSNVSRTSSNATNTSSSSKTSTGTSSTTRKKKPAGIERTKTGKLIPYFAT